MAAEKVVHNVFFSLKDNSAEAVERLVAACKKYLCDHPGVEFFAAGTLAGPLAREVNDREFDVALHVAFSDMAAHDAYQEAAAHARFIEENQSNWSNVRVFDSCV